MYADFRYSKKSVFTFLSTVYRMFTALAGRLVNRRVTKKSNFAKALSPSDSTRVLRDRSERRSEVQARYRINWSRSRAASELKKILHTMAPLVKRNFIARWKSTIGQFFATEICPDHYLRLSENIHGNLYSRLSLCIPHKYTRHGALLKLVIQ